MNVLSLFDGMSCGQIALNRLGIKIDNYFASEIDTHAITVAKANFPTTQHIGSVVNVDGYSLPKIDLLIGGSPCQSFSFAGKRKGMSTKDEQEILTLEHYLQLKSENYEFEGQSYLFWEYMRLLNEVKPKYFLLENVVMAEKWEKILSKAIGVNPILINSNLLSAQNRERLYWTNIGMEPTGLFGYPMSTIEQPKDKGILLKDILESKVEEKYFLSEKRIKINENKSMVFNNTRLNETIEKHKDNLENGTLIDAYNKTIQKEKSITISTRVDASNCTFILGGDIYSNEGFRWRENGKSITLNTKDGALTNYPRIRKLTPIECERLQTVPYNYTNYVSNTQRYRMLGNGWTVDVIAYIFSYLK
jgi:DNA (cytosine-5)-methyltransferase 3A